ncbi:MAG: formate dehydrogenase accessory protein FdhE [Eggerthellaceae bacterium]|jgi:FdhE protein|nr:formate dehydrogenase accessory protein FdhE [Eggerthellaceae bacterium]MDR2721605.1 formate dehydrogenase accessory protein FdhE [Coriobacteriaceae bacterium]
MNKKKRNLAAEAYKARLDEAGLNRLMLFDGIWKIQDKYLDSATKKSAYALPNTEVAEHWYWQEQPFFSQAPISFDADLFASALKDIAEYLVDKAGLEKNVAACLKSFDWRELVDKTDVAESGRNPSAYAQDFCAQAHALSGEVLQPEMAVIVLGLALRPFLEHGAHALMTSLASVLEKGNATHAKPLYCPSCGGQAVAAFVGETPSNQGNGRLLYCSACGTAWEFERVRCATCGTNNQQHLHYYHIEGDDAHRLHMCDECGAYMRTVFQESLEVPFSFEVEDIVMAPLDALAHDPRFELKKDSEE